MEVWNPIPQRAFYSQFRNTTVVSPRLHIVMPVLRGQLRPELGCSSPCPTMQRH
jgi:hypothetical protein